MTRIIERRRSLHRKLEEHRHQSDTMKLQIGQLQALANIGTTTCMIAHEINNLLTPLSSYAELALAHPDDKALAQKALEKTTKNCKRASAVMETILNVAGTQKHEKEDVALLETIEEIFACLCMDFGKDSITVKLEMPWDLTFYAIRVEIQQVLMNLILNARDAMLGRGGVLTIKARHESDNTLIEVRDTGCGIKTDDIEKIFDPFFSTKVKTSRQSQKQGAGLGLAFCKKIVDSYSGSISVESSLGEGTSFVIRLPGPL